jgi:hypothetical protein
MRIREERTTDDREGCQSFFFALWNLNNLSRMENLVIVNGLVYF